MLLRKRSVSGTRIVLLTFLAVLSLLWAGTQVHAQQAGVGFTFAGTEESLELINSYQDLAALTITARQNGYVVLTGSGYLNLTTSATFAGSVWGQAGISIGTISGASNNDNETAVEIPFAQGGGYSYKHPFSITTVIPVKRGKNSFYMVGIRDPNTTYSTWYATGLKLTAVYIPNRID